MGLRSWVWSVRKRLQPRRPRPAILMYHRVASVRHDPWDLAVAPARFEEQVAYIKRHRTPMSMDEMADRLREGNLPADAVAITFDDGYLDNLIHAKPVLARHGVPATVFIATGYVGSGMPFWWDELASMVLESKEPVHQVAVCGNDSIELDWDLPESFDLHPAWRGWDEPRTARQRAYVKTWARLQRAARAERDRTMESLRERFQTVQDPLAIPMSRDEIGDLVGGDIIRIGAHTVSHPALTDLDRAESRREIDESQQYCRGLTPKPVDGFAYPFGNLDKEVRDDVGAVGLSWACTTEVTFVDRREPDLLALPRFAATNAPMRVFRSLLTG